MRIFIDTANVNEIREANELGVISGVTTNPSLIAKEGRDFKEVVKEITQIVDGPISAEVISLDADEMVKIIEKEFSSLAVDYLLNQKEADNKVIDIVNDYVDMQEKYVEDMKEFL